MDFILQILGCGALAIIGFLVLVVGAMGHNGPLWIGGLLVMISAAAIAVFKVGALLFSFDITGTSITVSILVGIACLIFAFYSTFWKRSH